MSLEPDKDSLLYQKPKTRSELKREQAEKRKHDEERNIKLTRIARGVGIVIRGIGSVVFKLGDGIVAKCDKSLGSPENRRVLRRLGKLPDEEKKEKKENVKASGKSIVINVGGD